MYLRGHGSDSRGFLRIPEHLGSSAGRGKQGRRGRGAEPQAVLVRLPALPGSRRPRRRLDPSSSHQKRGRAPGRRRGTRSEASACDLAPTPDRFRYQNRYHATQGKVQRRLLSKWELAFEASFRLIGEAGFEPATARPPAGEHGCHMRPDASHASLCPRPGTHRTYGRCVRYQVGTTMLQRVEP